MFGNRNRFPLIDAFLGRFAGSMSNYEKDFLKARASVSRSFECYDFNQIAQSGAQYGVWTVAATSTGTTWAALAEPGGWLRYVTGASVATAGGQIFGNTKFWNGTKGAGMASLIRVSAVTDVRIEQGFVDVAPANNTTVINFASNSFNSVTTGAVYMYDNGVAASTTQTGLFTVGTSTAMQTVATSTNRYDSAATLFVAIEIIGTTVKLWLGPDNLPTATITSAFAASEAWVPFVGVKSASGSKNFDIDALWTWTNGRN